MVKINKSNYFKIDFGKKNFEKVRIFLGNFFIHTL